MLERVGNTAAVSWEENSLNHCKYEPKPWEKNTQTKTLSNYCHAGCLASLEMSRFKKVTLINIILFPPEGGFLSFSS